MASPATGPWRICCRSTDARAAIAPGGPNDAGLSTPSSTPGALCARFTRNVRPPAAALVPWMCVWCCYSYTRRTSMQAVPGGGRVIGSTEGTTPRAHIARRAKFPATASPDRNVRAPRKAPDPKHLTTGVDVAVAVAVAPSPASPDRNLRASGKAPDPRHAIAGVLAVTGNSRWAANNSVITGSDRGRGADPQAP